MHSVSERILDAGDIQRNFAESLSRRLGRNNRVWREAPVDVDAQNLRITTDVRLAGKALLAFSADDMRFAGDFIAHGKICDADADVLYNAAKFMSDNARWHDALRRPIVPLVNVHVRTTDASVFNGDFHTTRRDGGFRYFDEIDARRWAGFCNRFQDGGILPRRPPEALAHQRTSRFGCQVLWMVTHGAVKNPACAVGFHPYGRHFDRRVAI